MKPQAFDTILNDLKNQKYYPVYLLHGDEPFFIDEIINVIENEVVDESLRDFNQTIVYGRDVTARDIADLSSRFPMMGDKQVVIVKEAQELTANNRKLDDLEPYIENPSDSTILVLGFKHKKIDKRKGLYKKLLKSDKAVIFESAKLYENQIPAWINKYVSSKGYSIDATSTRLLADHVGSDLSRLANEINKLFINLPENGEITVDLIERNIGISKDFNIFELTKALGNKDIFKALRIIKYFEANPKDNPLQMVTVMLYNYFVKVFLFHGVKDKNKYEISKILGISPAFVSEYAVAARNYPRITVRKIIGEIKMLDLKSKGFGTVDAKSYGPLTEFVYKCIHNTFPVFNEE